MKKVKLLVTLSAVTVLLASLLAGCSKKADESQPSSSIAATAAATAAVGDAVTPAPATDDSLKEHLDISVSWWGIGVAFEKHDEIIQKLEKDFNITLKAMDIGWDNYKEKSQVWAAAGELPDIITHSLVNDNPATYNEWVKQDLIHALPQDLSKYPNVEKVAKATDVQGLYRDGKLYAIPRLTYPNTDMWAVDRAIYVRKDWMDKLGIKDPQNFAEFNAMLKAFVEKDPDGNNKKDTAGIVMNTMGYFNSVFVPTFPQFGNKSWLKEDGKWIPFYASKQMDAVVVQARQLYAEGGLDQDFAVEKSGEGNQKFYQSKAGAFALNVNAVQGSTGVKAEWEKGNPGQNFYDHVKLIHLWPAADSNVYRHTTTSFWSETMINADVNDAKLDRILKLYDWLLSPAGKEMFDFGIEGKDYTKDGDKITVTREKDEKGQLIDLKKKYPSMDTISQLAMWRNASSLEDSDANKAAFGEENVKFIQDELNWQMTNAKAIPTEFTIATLSTPAKDKLSAITFDDDFVRVILSKEDPVKMWHDILKSYDSKGLQAAITEVTAEMAKQGK
ncbi:extracellular solute-binding protein [Paenibacillus psychroresistens]|uniref:Extracellular solute-binding protein n=1 Tax=Paenibacillus psychroresistens TaxID=1778678 RepID=A0A6B8RR69_9BACL|nr:extracellular solute-binding protein [Paenibacillus psychroresistens]QGQ98202.1 extracellular solute-binding protein [Paenibacillus psychroresistens]